MKDDNLLTTQEAAKLIGISDGQFRRLTDKLGINPDGHYTNPYYRSAAPGNLYHKDTIRKLSRRVDTIKAKKRKANPVLSEMAIATKLAKMQELVNSIEIDLDDTIPLHKLRIAAIASYNSHNLDRGKHASKNPDPSFLDRITVNYIRHEMTHYDGNLYSIRGMTGKSLGHDILKERVLDKI
jgi:hypothetical protein